MGNGAALRVGVVGLGEIGAGVARAVARAGMPLVVCDVRPEATAALAEAAVVAPGPAELGAACDVVVVAVVDDAQVREVLDPEAGVLSTLPAGGTVLVLSTVSLATLEAVADSARTRRLSVVDCGVSGGPVAAAEGALVAMLGGEPAARDGVRPVVEAFSSLVVDMGPLGAGLQAKLARNLVQYGSWLAAYEAQVLAEAAGIDLAKLALVIRASDEKIGGASRLMFRRSVAPFGPSDDAGIVHAMERGARLAHKDLQAALALADRLGVPLPLCTMTDARTDAVFGLAPDPIAGASLDPAPVDRPEEVARDR